MSPFRKAFRTSALSLLLAGIASAAGATPITYNVNFGIGTAVATGTIQTDGSLGTLSPSAVNPSQILNWSLTVTDPANSCAALPSGTGPCTVSFQGPFGTTFNGGVQGDILFGNALIATTNKLYFDTTKAGFLRFNSLPGGEVCFGVGQVCAIVAGFDDSVRLNPGHKLVTSPLHPNGADYQRQNNVGPVILATVPEPSSLAVMAGAMAMLGLLFGFAHCRRPISTRV